MPISSTGLSSGLDVESLVAKLVQAEVVPASQRFALAEAKFQSEISAYGSLQSALASLQSASSSASDSAQYTALKASTSSFGFLTADASQGAATGAYEVEVQNLAERQSLASAAYESQETVVGTGTVTLTIGTTTYDSSTDVYSSFNQKSGTSPTTITIDSSNNTLRGIRDAINSSGVPATASIVNDGTGFRLVLQSQTEGAENSLALTVTDSGDSNNTDTLGLSALAFNVDATNLLQTNSASDAALTVNGLGIVSASNTVSTALEGISLTLQKVTTDPVTLDVSADTAKAVSAVQAFIDAYNEFTATVNDLTAYDIDSGTGSTLTGDSTVRGALQTVRNRINSPVDLFEATYKTLAELGVTTNVSDGSLSLDTSKLESILAANPTDVAKVMAGFGSPTNDAVAFVSSTNETDAGSYAVSLSVTSSSASYETASSSISPTNNKTLAFDLTVNGVKQSINYDTGGGNPSYGDIATGLTSAITSAFGSAVASVSSDGSSFIFQTTLTGSASSLRVDNISADSSSFGLGDSGLVSGSTSYSGLINGFAASFDESSRTLTGAAGTSVEGLVLKIADGASGDLGSVFYTLGIGNLLEKEAELWLSDDGLIQARINGLGDSISDISKQRDALDLRAVTLEQQYRAQFNGLETLISQLNTTQQFLSQALGGFVKPNTTLQG